MGTVVWSISPLEYTPATANGGQPGAVIGSAFPVVGIWFDSATDETVYTQFDAVSYGSGNITLDIDWYADGAVTSGNVVFTAAIACITPNTDSQDLETKTFATEQSVTDSHLGTTAQRLHTASLTISNLDSIAAGDSVALKLYRNADDASDTLAADAVIYSTRISYSDT